MSLAAGTRIGSYEILALIGVGGMGEVYRARDSKLNREVALRVLPDLFASDPDRLARFEREAQLLASLNHPNIASIYGLEETTSGAQTTIRALVLEIVEGETLADRLRGGAMPIDEALAVALQVVEALEAAHERGIIHRDLKPGNIKITTEGKVKVLDFGLAKALGPVEGSEGPGSRNQNLSHSPTLSAATRMGIILGTAAYMSPEQAKGTPADQRSDVFSFGCVLYEMLSGRQAFQAETAAETLASVLMREPELTLLPPVISMRLRDLIRRCLEKNPRRRWQAVGDLRVELEAIAANPRGAPAAPIYPPAPIWKRALPVVVTAAVFTLVGAFFARPTDKPAVPAPVVRFPLRLPDDQELTTRAVGPPQLDLSPDGARLVYATNNQLYLRELSEMEATPIPGTNVAAASPFFSPDGRWIGYFSLQDNTLRKIPLNGGSSVTICSTPFPGRVSWSGDTILFTTPRGIMRVSSNGGEAEVLIPLISPQGAYGPSLINEGRAVLFALVAETGPERWDTANIVVHELDSDRQTVVARGGNDPRLLPSGHLVYAVGSSLFAVPFDRSSLKTLGSAASVAQGIARGNSPVAQYALSANGSLIFVEGTSASRITNVIAFADRTGKIEPTTLPPSSYVHPRISADGKRLAVATEKGREAAVWVHDLNASGGLRQLTLEGQNRYPIWTRDSTYITFQSVREGGSGVYRQRADGAGVAELIVPANPLGPLEPESWHPDGTLLFDLVRAGDDGGIWAARFNGKRTVESVIDLPNSTQKQSVFSPNGRWVAYMSSEMGGTTNVFVEPWPATGARYRASTETGTGRAPLWTPDGNQLIYHNGNTNQLIAVDFITAPGVGFGKATVLPIKGTVHPGAPSQRNYDIMPDGKQFIVVMPSSTTQTAEEHQTINVVLNWIEEVKTRVPVP